MTDLRKELEERSDADLQGYFPEGTDLTMGSFKAVRRRDRETAKLALRAALERGAKVRSYYGDDTHREAFDQGKDDVMGEIQSLLDSLSDEEEG